MRTEEIGRRLKRLEEMRELVGEGDPVAASQLELLVADMKMYLDFLAYWEEDSGQAREDLAGFKRRVMDALTPEMETAIAEAEQVMDDMDAVAMKALGIKKARR